MKSLPWLADEGSFGFRDVLYTGCGVFGVLRRPVSLGPADAGRGILSTSRLPHGVRILDHGNTCEEIQKHVDASEEAHTHSGTTQNDLAHFRPGVG